MRLLCKHARQLGMIVKDRSGPPSKQRQQTARLRTRLGSSLPALDEGQMQTISENALFAQICVEEGDEKLDLGMVRDRLVRLARQLKVEEIVVTPFGHLSEIPAKGGIARQIIDELTMLTQKIFPQTKAAPFGWDKSLQFIDVPCHPRNVSGMYFYYDSRNPWDKLAEDYDEFFLKSGRYNAQHSILSMMSAYLQPPVLELCCGTGRSVHILNRMGRSAGYVGIDSSEEMIWLARRLESVLEVPNGKEPDSVFICGRAEDVGNILENSAFNTILLSNASRYVDMKRVLEEVPHLMNDGAKMIVLEEQRSGDVSGLVHPVLKRLEELAKDTVDLKGLERRLRDNLNYWITETVPIDEISNLVGMVFKK